jgi:hypothetical protein
MELELDESMLDDEAMLDFDFDAATQVRRVPAPEPNHARLDLLLLAA